jgi:SRSO17 transposase
LLTNTTGIRSKQGEHSVEAHHQYCGQLGKQANCQVAVTLSIANHHASLPIAYRLYLPKERIEDRLAAKRRTSLQRSRSRPSRRLRWSRSALLCWRTSLQAWC